MKTTTDHEEIRKWAHANQGTPEVVEDEEAGKSPPQLRINFPGKEDDIYLPAGKKRRSLTWDEFFTEFQHQELAFQYEETTQASDKSLSYLFLKRPQPGGSSQVEQFAELKDIPE